VQHRYKPAGSTCGAHADQHALPNRCRYDYVWINAIIGDRDHTCGEAMSAVAAPAPLIKRFQHAANQSASAAGAQDSLPH
jgi:hypothetical protein